MKATTLPRARVAVVSMRSLALPLVAEALVEHQGQDVILVVLSRGLAAEDVRCAPEMGFQLLKGELHAMR